MNDLLENIETFIEIHPDCRYVFMVTEHLSLRELDRLQQKLTDWWESGEPLLIIGSKNMVIKKIDGEEQEDE